jgi:hypothetical protein
MEYYKLLIWILLIIGSFLFLVIDINKLHILWISSIIAVIVFILNLTILSVKFVYIDRLNKNKIRTIFIIFWVGVILFYILSIFFRKNLSFVGSFITSKYFLYSFSLLLLSGVIIFVVYFAKMVSKVSAGNCFICKQSLTPLDKKRDDSSGIAILVQAGLSSHIGYECVNCGKKICQRCLEKAGGVFCPNCKAVQMLKYIKK